MAAISISTTTHYSALLSRTHHTMEQHTHTGALSFINLLSHFASLDLTFAISAFGGRMDKFPLNITDSFILFFLVVLPCLALPLYSARLAGNTLVPNGFGHTGSAAKD